MAGGKREGSARERHRERGKACGEREGGASLPGRKSRVCLPVRGQALGVFGGVWVGCGVGAEESQQLQYTYTSGPACLGQGRWFGVGRG